MATKINWTSSYSVKDAEIDSQHKKWIDLINSLSDAIEQGNGNSELNKIIDGIIRYTSVHFQFEQTKMLKANYPHYEQHKKLHDDFVIEIKELKNLANNSKDRATTMTLTKLINWFLNHIKKVDQLYAPYMEKKAA